jgi:hypothetical protein
MGYLYDTTEKPSLQTKQLEKAITSVVDAVYSPTRALFLLNIRLLSIFEVEGFQEGRTRVMMYVLSSDNKLCFNYTETGSNNHTRRNVTVFETFLVWFV